MASAVTHAASQARSCGHGVHGSVQPAVRMSLQRAGLVATMKFASVIALFLLLCIQGVAAGTTAAAAQKAGSSSSGTSAQLDPDNAYGYGTLPASVSSASTGKTGAVASATVVGATVASDWCNYRGQNYACGRQYSVPAQGNCGQCKGGTMTFWCDTPNSYGYCCGSQCSNRGRMCAWWFGG